MSSRQRPNSSHRSGAAQHPLGPVWVQADPLAVGRAERAGAVPDRAHNPGPAEVMHQRRQPHSLQFSEPHQPRRAVSQMGHVWRMTDEVGALQIRERAEREARPVELGDRYRQHRSGLGSAHRLDQVLGRFDRRQNLLGTTEERLTDRWVQVAARAPSDLSPSAGQTAGRVRDCGLIGDAQDPRDRVQALARAPGGQATPIPTLEHVPERPQDHRWQPKLTAEPNRHLA